MTIDLQLCRELVKSMTPKTGEFVEMIDKAFDTIERDAYMAFTQGVQTSMEMHLNPSQFTFGVMMGVALAAATANDDQKLELTQQLH